MPQTANVALELESRPDRVQHVSKQRPDPDVHGTATLTISVKNYNMTAALILFDNERVSDENIAEITLSSLAQRVHVPQRPSKWTAVRPGERVADIGEWRSEGSPGKATAGCTAHILDLLSRPVAHIDIACDIQVQTTKPQPQTPTHP